MYVFTPWATSPSTSEGRRPEAVVVERDGRCIGYGTAGRGNPTSAGSADAASAIVAATTTALERAGQRADGVVAARRDRRCRHTGRRSYARRWPRRRAEIAFGPTCWPRTTPAHWRRTDTPFAGGACPVASRVADRHHLRRPRLAARRRWVGVLDRPSRRSRRGKRPRRAQSDERNRRSRARRHRHRRGPPGARIDGPRPAAPARPRLPARTGRGSLGCATGVRRRRTRSDEGGPADRRRRGRCPRHHDVDDRLGRGRRSDRPRRSILAQQPAIAEAVVAAAQRCGVAGPVSTVADGMAGAAVLALRHGGANLDEVVFTRIRASLAALR